MSKRRPTLKQRLFAEAYVHKANGNATESARLAGYAGRAATLEAVGYENLRKPLVRELIDAELAKRQEAERGTVAEAQELRETWTELLRDSEEDPKVRLAASKLLAQAHGMFVKRVEATEADLSQLSPEQLKALADGKGLPEVMAGG